MSVRKRVIKILKDICVMQPKFPRVSEICGKMIRRINDEEGIKQLVTSVFQDLWFAVPPEGLERREVLIRRVTNITAVVRVITTLMKEFIPLLKASDSVVPVEPCVNLHLSKHHQPEGGK